MTWCVTERTKKAHERRWLALKMVQAIRSENKGRVAACAAAATANDVTRRSIRRWRARKEQGTLVPTNPGPAPKKLDYDTRRGVTVVLLTLGPKTGVNRIRAMFRTVPYRTIARIKKRLIRIESQRKRRGKCALTWRRPGATWAMDFTEPKAKLPGEAKRLLCIDDLASGMRLACVPCDGERTEVVIETLMPLFAIYGAPLVIKSDNGSAFTAKKTRAFLRRSCVLHMRSPARRPSYNGSCERRLGWLKDLIEAVAAARGHPRKWRSKDIAQAVTIANATLRPWGSQGPTPQHAFEQRNPMRARERARFRRCVARTLRGQLEARASGATLSKNARVHLSSRRAFEEGDGALSNLRLRIALLCRLHSPCPGADQADLSKLLQCSQSDACSPHLALNIWRVDQHCRL